MTLQKIARRSNVSIATVSRIINRIPTVNRALARRVQKVIEREGYYPNTQARALVSARSRLFGLIAELTGPGYPDMVQAFGKLGHPAQLRNLAEPDDRGFRFAGAGGSADDRA
jgi:LacI family transcriptional regulator, galactose operon repressor